MCGRGVVSEECVRRNAYIIIISPHNERIHKRIPLNASGIYKYIQTDIDRAYTPQCTKWNTCDQQHTSFEK